MIKVHMIIGGFISGVVLLSIVQNGYEISRWSVLNRLAKHLDKKLESDLNNGLGEAEKTDN